MKPKLALVISMLAVGWLLGLVASGEAGERQSSKATVTRGVRVQAELLAQPPQLSPEQLERMEEHLRVRHRPTPRTPEDPIAFRGDFIPPVPATRPSPLPRSDRSATGPQAEVSPQADPDFQVFRLNSFGGGAGTPTNGSKSRRTSEPSTGNNGNIIFQAGNWYATLSVDGGNSFFFVDPFTIFPPDYGGFCCDQVAIYDQSRDLLLWVLLYIDDGITNIIRLAVSKGADQRTPEFCTYDFTPAAIGGTPGVNEVFDFPDMALSNNSLYITSNVFLTDGGFTRAAIIRIPLNGLNCSSSVVSVDFDSDTGQASWRLTQGASQTMYYASHLTTSTLRINRWPENSGTIFFSDHGHASYPNGIPTCPGPDGRDWCGFSDDRILGSYIAQGRLGFFWGASQGSGGLGTFPFPYVHVARYNVAALSILDQPIIWNPDHAWIYPAIAPNARGHVAGPVAWGGGSTVYPNWAVVIADDFTPACFPATCGWEVYAFGPAGTNGPAFNRWGDYFTSRQHATNWNTWVVTGFNFQGGDEATNATPYNAWVGRERDNVNGRARIGIFRSGSWLLDYSGGGVWNGSPTDKIASFGISGDVPVVGDWVGNGYDRIAVFRNGAWFLDNGSLSWSGVVFDTMFAAFGLGSDRPGSIKWSSKTDPSSILVFRNGQWFIDANRNGAWNGCGTDACIFTFGIAGDIPLSGDWDGTHAIDCIGVYRPSNSAFYLDKNCNNSWNGIPTDLAIIFGIPGDTPVVGDWNGDGRAKIGVKRGINWFLDFNGNGTWDGCAVDTCIFGYGLSSDAAVAGQW